MDINFEWGSNAIASGFGRVEDIIGLIDWAILGVGEANADTASSTFLEFSAEFGGLDLILQLDGTNLTTEENQLTGGAINTITIYNADGGSQADAIAVFSGAFDGAVFRNLAITEFVVEDSDAIETYFGGLNWTYTGTNLDETLPEGIQSVDGVDIELRGSDTILLGQGVDIVAAGRGRDFIDGQAGRDVLYGEEGGDEIYGGTGFDTLFGGGGNDTLDGGGGDDLMSGGAGQDLMYGGNRNDMMSGGGGSDRMEGGRGKDQMDGGGGKDLLFGGDNSDLMAGGAGDDRMGGGGQDDGMFGGAGDDVMYGQGQDDGLIGGTGNDSLFGGNGIDVLFGDSGDDVLKGGRGADFFVFDAQAGNNVITDFTVGADVLAIFDGGPVDLGPEGARADVTVVTFEDEDIFFANEVDLIETFASVTAEGVLFDFENGATYLLEGLSTTNGLAESVLLASNDMDL